MYKRLVTAAAISGISVFLLNQLAIAFYWYVSIVHFDKVVHTIGGIFVALVGSAFFYKHFARLRKADFIISILLFVFIVGLVWEYYEYVVQFFIKTVHLADVPDSIGDLCADMLGGIFGASFVLMLQKRYNRR